MNSLVTLFRRSTGELDVVAEPTAEKVTVALPDGFRIERDSCGELRVAAPSVNLAIDVAIDAGIVRLSPASPPTDGAPPTPKT